MAEPVRQAETPFKVVIVGAGRVGSALALLLKQAAEFEVVVVDPTDLMADLHSTAEYRANLVKVMAKRAVSAS